MKTTLILTRFRRNFGTSRFDEKVFFNTLVGFTPYWDCKPTNAIDGDSPGVYTEEKNLNLSTLDKIDFELHAIDGSIVSGSR